jgi:hypothetical protein
MSAPVSLIVVWFWFEEGSCYLWVKELELVSLTSCSLSSHVMYMSLSNY